MTAGGYVLLYDADCGLCSALGRLVRALDVRRRIRTKPILASRDLLRAVPVEEHLAAFHVISPDGRISSGGDAVPELVGAFPVLAGMGRLLRESAVLMALTRRAYGVAARLRDALTCRVRASPSAWTPDD